MKTKIILIIISILFSVSCKKEFEKIKIPISNKSSKNLKAPVKIYEDLNINGLWRIYCENSLTTLNIDKSEGYLSLYSFNSIYINIIIFKNKKKSNEFYLRFKNLASQNIYYEDKKILVEEDISKDENIGKLTLYRNKMIIDWYGLYNIKKQEKEFVKDAVFIIENDDKNKVVFKKCE